MIVMKFGGTALQNPGSIKKVISVIKTSLKEDPLVVVSAFGKSTRMLEGLFELCSQGNFEESYEIIDNSFLPLSLSLFEGYMNPKYEADCRKEVIKQIEDLKSYINSSNRKWDLVDRDHILSRGELITSKIIYYILNSEGIKSEWLDAREMIITDEKHRFSQPEFNSSVELVNQKINSCKKDNKLPITQGFIASTPSGLATTLGYEGSDLSATFLGACINASRVELYKTVPGIMTADPNLVTDSRLVRRVSYKYIEKLTFLGSKILHKNAIKPSMEKDIPLWIKNLYEPEETGTLIGGTAYDDFGSEFFVVGHSDGILFSKHVSEINILAESDKISSIFDEWDIANVPIENKIDHIQWFLPDKVSSLEATHRLREIDAITWNKNVSMIGIIYNSTSGNDLTRMISNIINEHQAKVLATSTSSDMIILVISRNRFKQVYHAVHRMLREHPVAA